MREFTIFTDSSCDLSATMAQELGLTVLPLSVNIDGTSYENDLAGKALPFDTCYALLRAGKPATTSAVNVSQFVEAMEPVLQAGQDILYLGFSSALSGTYNAGAVACAQLAEQYPEAKLYAVDTLCASLGQGMLIYLAVQQKRAGKSIEEVRDYVEENKLHLCHWFTVDDLHHLHRGGRVSATSAVLGTMLNIKPVLHVDDEGRLIFVEKVRGRRTSLKALLQHMEATAIAPETQTIFISHGDCLEEAQLLGQMIRDKLHVQDVVINYVGPVIGAHSGPGTLALFFLGTKR